MCIDVQNDRFYVVLMWNACGVFVEYRSILDVCSTFRVIKFLDNKNCLY